ncbi:hypothetical protein SLEP1_g45503 [Rubroshorea leprosula]|uniref:Heat shock protein 90 n=1 Tax=Rubroshorea leprosula TaxID=152421 RepID=A0AAV5LLH7_9ROSI|nr:hypothetical protein SLEP1_g45503 [Rubroshorea leprosula]
MREEGDTHIRGVADELTEEDLRVAVGVVDNQGEQLVDLIEEIKRLSVRRGWITLVGFYSAYLVAEKVIVTTKHNDDEQYVWESQADGSFTVTRDTSGENLGKGTKITLFPKEDQLEYLEEHRLKDLINNYPEFISYPISLWVGKTTKKEISDNEDEEEKKDEEGKVEDIDEDKEKEKKKKKIKEVSHEWRLVNKQEPIWTRKPEEITTEEYAALYKRLTNDWEEHLSVSLLRALLGSGLSFLFPREHPLISLTPERSKPTLRCMYPMPLQNKILKVICKNLVKKCIELFFEIAEDKEDYNKFYESFSKNLKLGILEDSQNRTKIGELLSYYSTKSGDEMANLKEYVTRMKEEQNDIYYITCASKKAVEISPFLEKLERKGYKVLSVVDAIDEYTVGQLKEFEGKKLVPATREGLELDKGEDEEERSEAFTETLGKFFKGIKDFLAAKVEKLLRCVVIRGCEVALNRCLDYAAELLVEVAIERLEGRVLMTERIGFFCGFTETCQAEVMAVYHVLVLLHEDAGVVERQNG